MNYAVVSPGTSSSAEGDKIFYSAKKFSVNQLRSVALSALPLEEGKLQTAEEKISQQAPSASLSDYKIRRYNPLGYMTDFSFTPFFPIKILDFSEGNLYWPGLGLTIESQTDPCMNTQAVLSAGWSYLPMDFSWTSNIPSSYLAKIRTESNNLNKDKTAAFFIENSSTPVRIKAGTIFNCNLDGQYNFKVLAGGQWKAPVGIALRHMIFNLQASYNVSTDYYDQTQRDIRPSLSDWPSFSEAYEMYEVSAKIEYTNIHQYGYSTFEQRGLSIGMRAYSMWDMCEVKLLREARKEKQEKSGSGEGSSEGEKSKEDEFHNTVIPAFLYSRRAGLWFGYNMALVYDTAEVRLPDIRRRNYLAEVFTDISYTHAIYMVLNLDLNILTGKLSTVPINTTLTGTYYPESRGYGISLDVRLHL